MLSRNGIRRIRRNQHNNSLLNPAMAGVRANSVAMFDNRSGQLPKVYGTTGGTITAVSGIDATYTGLYGNWDPGAGDIFTLPAPTAGLEAASTWWIVASIGSDPGGDRNLIGRRVTQATNSLGWVLVMEAGGVLRSYFGDGSSETNPDAGAVSVPVDGTPFVATVDIVDPLFNAARVTAYDTTNGYQTSQGALPSGTPIQDDAIATGWGGNASLDGPEWTGDIYGGGYTRGYGTLHTAAKIASAFGIL